MTYQYSSIFKPDGDFDNYHDNYEDEILLVQTDEISLESIRVATGSEFIICTDAIDHRAVFLPYLHANCCVVCAETQLMNDPKCPTCRSELKAIKKSSYDSVLLLIQDNGNDKEKRLDALHRRLLRTSCLNVRWPKIHQTKKSTRKLALFRGTSGYASERGAGLDIWLDFLMIALPRKHSVMRPNQVDDHEESQQSHGSL